MLAFPTQSRTCSKILIPYSDAPDLDHLFKTVADLAHANSAKLLLLRVAGGNDACPAWDESLYTMMRGLQARLQLNKNISLAFDTLSAANGETISDYAEDHDIDLIVLSGEARYRWGGTSPQVRTLIVEEPEKALQFGL